MPAVATSSSTVNGGNIVATANASSPTGLHVRVGDLVGPHPAAPFGVGMHVGATIAQGSTLVTNGGLPVAFEGCLASCGHTIDAGTGYQPVQIAR